jgi:hypothetical protein
MENNKAATYEDDIRAIDPQHGIDRAKVAEMREHLRQHGWTWERVLVVEDEGNGCAVIDGHHRAEAAIREGMRVPAWVISSADYAEIIEREFYGYAPGRLCDLDDYISLPDGRSYAESGVRADSVVPA